MPRRPKLGQHFLADPRVVARMLEHARLRGDETVLEVGPGKGVLTRALAPRVKQVFAIEKDAELVDVLHDEGMPGNVELVHGDALKEDLPAFDKVVASLPYGISSDFTFRILGHGFELAVMLYQLEFAERLVAKPGTEAYGRLSVNASVKAETEILDKVPPKAFRPPPRVSSAIVRLTPRAEPPFPLGDAKLYEEVVRAAFQHRRKTLRNALLDQWPAFAPSREALLDIAGKVPHAEARAGTLRPEQYGEVADALRAARGAR